MKKFTITAALLLTLLSPTKSDALDASVAYPSIGSGGFYFGDNGRKCHAGLPTAKVNKTVLELVTYYKYKTDPQSVACFKVLQIGINKGLFGNKDLINVYSLFATEQLEQKEHSWGLKTSGNWAFQAEFKIVDFKARSKVLGSNTRDEKLEGVIALPPEEKNKDWGIGKSKTAVGEGGFYFGTPKK